nr:hypothetical protein [Mycobacterium lepromatosis]
MPSIDTDHDSSHQAENNKLSKPIYSKASAAQRFYEWINELLYRLPGENVLDPGLVGHHTMLLILLVISTVVTIHRHTAHHAHQSRQRPSVIRRYPINCVPT